jgi:hypothetical protein
MLKLESKQSVPNLSNRDIPESLAGEFDAGDRGEVTCG